MQCKYVRESTCMSFAFHPKGISLFTVVHFKNRLRIVQENLYTGLIINDFPVPLKEQALEVDNYTLCYNEELDLVILTLSNHVLIYSLEKKVLLAVAEVVSKNAPAYIIKAVTRKNNLFYSASEQKLVFGINLEQTIKSGAVTSYAKYKVPNDAEIEQIAASDSLLVALCKDGYLRVWQIETTNPLKGIILENIGRPVCMSFSKDEKYLLIGTSEGYVQAWDGETLGVRNIKIMSQKISNCRVQSLCWFHYSGESQSLRFLVFTEDGSVKLYSFWFEKRDEAYVGKCTELSLLYINRHEIQESFAIRAHSFANFIFFSPGILLYMVDSHSLIYYPVVMKCPSASFDELAPNSNKQIYFPRDMIFMTGLEIKRVKDTIEDKLTLQNDLEYEMLKILKLDMRPCSNTFASSRSKLMVSYHLNSSTRVLTISNVNLNSKNENLAAYKQYSGSSFMFLGPKQYYEPFVLIVQEDKQTITVLMENNPHQIDLKLISEEERGYFGLGPGEIYTKKINIKIQKVYPTPFRNNYVVLYQSENLLRFSSNINFDAELVNYDVYTGLSLRLDYLDIVLDVIWTYGGEMGAVICLDKVVFINADLKIMKSVLVAGYVVQGLWIGYTLLVTTKKDVQYFDILSKPQQAFCLESLESKYLIMRVMADRVFVAEKDSQGNTNIKARYFKLMEPLISGYLNYTQIAEIPIDQQKIKLIIECLGPYYIVSEEFIHLLNNRGLSSVSRYFLFGNQKMYSKPLRAKTLNDYVKIQRFIPAEIWTKYKKTLLDLYLSYEQSKDSTDPYERDKGKFYAERIRTLVGSIPFDSIKDLSSSEGNKGVTIMNSFGERNLHQLYYDVSEQGQQLKMEIHPFKAENIGEWLGQFGMYIESSPYAGEEATEARDTQAVNILGTEVGRENDYVQSDEDEENEFKKLVVYYRCDDGKGTTVEDLSDYGNHGAIDEEDNWIALQDEPLELEDKWGKKCPPQFSLTAVIELPRRLITKPMLKLTIELWIKPLAQNYVILRLGKEVQISSKKKSIDIKIDSSVLKLKSIKQQQNSLDLNRWTHLTITLDTKSSSIRVLFNCVVALEYEGPFRVPKIPQALEVGDRGKNLQYTEFRLWRKLLDPEDIKQNMRTPLSIVAEKRKRLTMKLKSKKKKESASEAVNPFSFDL